MNVKIVSINLVCDLNFFQHLNDIIFLKLKYELVMF